MLVSLIVAMDEAGVIGRDNALPWRLPDDLKRFKALTLGKPVLMGRKTFESIGKPLAGRRMIIVTRDPDYKITGCVTAHSIRDAIELARDQGETELFICGGAEVYAQTLELAERLYLTQVHADCDADTFFPELDRDDWIEQSAEPHAADEKNDYPFTFLVLVKKRAG